LLRVLIIDDERAVRAVIREIVRQFIPQAEIVGEADGVASGFDGIHEFQPDIVLLDIHLMDGTGFDLLARVDDISFKVIFISAYEKYAVEAFKYSAVDYILKPIDPEELQAAVIKAGNQLQKDMVYQLNALRENLNPENNHKKILLKTLDNIFLVRINDIICCESDQVYTRLFLEPDRMIMVSRQLKEFEEMFRNAGFFRVHKSYLINMHCLDHYERSSGGFAVMNNGMKIPVASRKRDQFLKLIENLT
jgi:two-component system LytT family response regulator